MEERDESCDAAFHEDFIYSVSQLESILRAGPDVIGRLDQTMRTRTTCEWR